MKTKASYLLLAILVGSWMFAQAPLPSPVNGGGGGSSKGTVTSVTCGSGLTGGTITTTGTCVVDGTVVAKKYFGTTTPGSVSGNLPGDFFTDTTGHKQYVCNAPSGTAAPACTSVAAAGWLLFGDVVGPSSATDNALARLDGTTGKLIQNGLATEDDSGNISTPGGISTGVGGSVAGHDGLGAGTTTAAATGIVGFQAPAAVSTPFYMNLPAAPVTGLIKSTGTSDPAVLSFVPTGTGVDTALGIAIDTTGGVCTVGGAGCPGGGSYSGGTICSLGVGSLVANTGSPVTVATCAVSSLATGQCLVIQNTTTMGVGGNGSLLVYVDAVLIATVHRGLGGYQASFNALHCNITAQSAQQTTYPQPLFIVNSGTFPTTPAASDLDSLGYTTQSIDWTTSHTLTIQTDGASGNSQSIFLRVSQ